MSFNWKATIIWSFIMITLLASTMFPFYMGGIGGGNLITIISEKKDYNDWTESDKVLDTFTAGLYEISLLVFKIAYSIVYVVGIYYINATFFDVKKAQLISWLSRYRLSFGRKTND